jgi:hypothetical protein
MYGMASKKAKLYKRYPASSILLYNGSTLVHFLLGSAGIMLGYRAWPWLGIPAGLLYLGLALAEMYLLMPLKVCPHCVYYRLEGGLCISGLNVISQRYAQEGEPGRFAGRAQGLLCANNLYLASLIAPILALIPALILDFAWAVLAILLALVGLLLFRFFAIFPQVACLHCYAKHQCPQAEAMGVRHK